MKIEKFELSDVTEGKYPIAGFSARFVNNKEVKILGKRIFLQTKKYFNSRLSKISNAERKTPIKILDGFTQRDTLNYLVPENCTLEKSWKPISIENEFGTYQRTFVLENNVCSISRTLILNKGEYPATKYPEFLKFINGVVKADNEKIVLLKE